MCKPWTSIARALGLAIIIVAGSTAAYADESDHRWEDDDRSYDRARRAVARGDILPMATLRQRLLARIPGEVIDVELEREHGRWIYEFKVVDERGRLLEVYVDARTGAIVSIEDD